jgi:hypothetical protein
MADVGNVDSSNGFWPVALLSGGTGAIPTFQATLAANQAITAGDALVSNGDGTCQIALHNSAAIFGVAAETKVSDTSTQNLLIYPALPWILFEAQCAATYAITIRYTAVDIQGSTGAMEVEENATTYGVFWVINENPETPVGDYTRVRGVFIQSSFLELV